MDQAIGVNTRASDLIVVKLGRLMIIFDSIKSAAKAYQAIDQLLATAP